MILSAGTPFAERVDPRTLRTEALDRAALQQVLADERARRQGLSDAGLRQSLTRSGTAARMLGVVAVAVADLSRAVELADDAEPAATVHQHLGKFAFDGGDFAAAVQHFDRALRLRTSGGDPELVASSDLALRVARDRLAG